MPSCEEFTDIIDRKKNPANQPALQDTIIFKLWGYFLGSYGISLYVVDIKTEGLVPMGTYY